MTERPVDRAVLQGAIRERTLADANRRGAELVREYRRRFGRVLNADNASELFEDYSASHETRATRVAAVRPAAARIVEVAFTELLSEPVDVGRTPLVVFMSGGNGAGKSSSIAAGDPAHIVFDSTLSQFEPSRLNIERALAAGLDVEIRHLARDLEESWDAVMDRAMHEGNGRTVTLAGFLATHRGARATFVRLAEHYVGNSRVGLLVYENGAALGRGVRSLDWLRARPAVQPELLSPKLREALDQALAGGRVTSAVYEGCGS